jgi:hypothetical protein
MPPLAVKPEFLQLCYLCFSFPENKPCPCAEKLDMSAAATLFLEVPVPSYRRNSGCGPEACSLADMICVRHEHLAARVE